MNTRSLPLKRAVRQALLTGLVVSAAGYAGAASAQGQAGVDAGTIDEIRVTGSRLIRSRDFIEVSPVQTVEFEEIQSVGNLTLEDTLNRFPQLAPDQTSATNQSGGSGVLPANLRGLGATRTLVLVDGRRFVPGDVTGIADLATIPDMLIERVEIVTGGASAVYGSDAIAGAVNFVMRDSFDGAEIRYQFGETSRGDGTGHKVDLLLGTTLGDGRGSVMLHGNFTDRDPVFMGDRAFSRQPLLADSNGVLQPFGVASIPEGFIGIQPAQFDQVAGIDWEAAQAACPGPVQGIKFEEGGVPSAFCRPTDQFNYAAPNYLLRPLQRWQINALGNYDLADNIEVYAQFFYAKKENAFQMAPLNISPTSPGEENGTIRIPNAPDNPLFSQPLRDFFAANEAFFDPEGDGVFRVRNTARRFNEFGPRNSAYTTDSFNFTSGLRGDFEVAGNSWFWDAFHQFARSDVTQNYQGLLSSSRLTAGLDVVLDEDGNAQCAQPLLNCVPVNIFGPGELTPEMTDYIQTSTTTLNRFTRAVAGGSVAGDLAELPAGPLSSAFGVEWRRESFETIPDPAAIAGDLGGTPPVLNDGNFNIFEVFGELRVPLVSGVTGIDELALEGAVRYADYSTIGSVTAWSLSLDWGINESVRARGGFSRAIRAPNLNELFAPVSTGFQGGVDPCWAVQNPTPAQQELCIQQGVPAEFADNLGTPANQGFQVETGGNEELEQEDADTITLGVVFTPQALPSLSMSLDYYRIKVDEAISTVTPQLLVNRCFETLDAQSTACQSISRLSSGFIDRVRAPLLNVAERKVDGVDLQVRYGIDEGPSWLSLPGRSSTLDFTLVLSRQFENVTTPFEGEAKVDCAGFYGGPCSSDAIRIAPDFRGILRTEWRSGPFRVTPEIRYVGRLKLHPNAFPNENGTLSAWTYLDLTAGYELSERVRFFGGINNVFDKQPPVIGFRAGGDSNTNVQLYDTLGRNYFIGASVGFGDR